MTQEAVTNQQVQEAVLRSSVAVSATQRTWSLSGERYALFGVNLVGDAHFDIHIKPEPPREVPKDETLQQHVNRLQCAYRGTGINDLTVAELDEVLRRKRDVAMWLQGELRALPPSDYEVPRECLPDAPYGILGAAAGRAYTETAPTKSAAY